MSAKNYEIRTITMKELMKRNDALVEVCEIMNRCSLSEMRQYCIKNNIHNGISDFSSALLMQRIAGFVLAKIEEEK